MNHLSLKAMQRHCAIKRWFMVFIAPFNYISVISWQLIGGSLRVLQLLPPLKLITMM
jgi:hypothetical protein